MKEHQLIKEIGKKLEQLKLTLVTAESCTGGYLAYYFSSHEETSSNLERGYVTYSNQSKEGLLGVTSNSLQLHGAVSREVAIEMAKGALKNSKAQISIATTGVAGENIHNKSGIVWMIFTRFCRHKFVKLRENNREVSDVKIDQKIHRRIQTRSSSPSFKISISQ